MPIDKDTSINVHEHEKKHGLLTGYTRSENTPRIVTFHQIVRQHGKGYSVYITIPRNTARNMGLKAGDAVYVGIELRRPEHDG